MKSSLDVLIAGAGIVGAACALELARAKMRVAIVDRSFPASGATGASMGHIVAMDDSEAQFALTRYSQVLWHELRDALPSTIEFDRCGTIWLSCDDEELAEARRKHAYYRERGVAAEILDSAAVHDAEPNLKTPMAGGLLVEGDAVVYPPAATAYFLERAAALGATVILDRSVRRLGGSQALLDDGTVISADKLINAAGCCAPELTEGIQVKPRKGHLVITDRYPDVIRHQLVELGYLKSAHSVTADSVAFNLQPRKTGQILIGSSSQYGAVDERVDTEMVSRMLHRAFEFVPKLESLSAIRVWTGYRPGTPDSLPLIGPWEKDPSVLLATGHEGLGITTSLATAKLIRAHIDGSEPAIPLAPYLPSRHILAEIHA
ncbi:MAG TPA: FAD-dependent oxidoreductase [Candidatus Acidoferrum sp.]|nr:FAD-dependent oxidoreductase [Candidatus Acidoferrum sp.]